MQAEAKRVAVEPQDAGAHLVRTKPQIICINDLIVHKYSEGDVLLRKADGVALSLIQEDLRPGEYVRAAKPGVYHLFLPRLREDAAQLRCAVLCERIFRTIRDLNPAAKVHTGHHESSPPGAEERKKPSSNPEHRLQANQAIQLMTRGCASRDELLHSEVGKFLSERASVSPVPVYYSEKKVIAGHALELTVGRGRLTADSAELAPFARPRDEISATIDLFTYKHALLQLERNAQRGSANLLMCPINISTVLRGRYRAAFLEGEVPAAAKEFLVLRARTFAEPFSRIKILDTAGYLRAKCRALVADVTGTAADFAVLKQAGFQSVGIEMPEINGPAFIWRHGSTLVARAKKAGLRSFVTNVRDREHLSASLSAGFSYICGAWFADA